MSKLRGGRHKCLATLPPEQVLPYTGKGKAERKFYGHMVKMHSLRYQCFQRSLKCACCGIVGTVMRLELPGNEKRPHFNLYAKREGALVLMTKDHITARSLGGTDTMDNLRTMCCRCNELLGNYGTKMKRLREIQDGVQTVYTLVYGKFEPLEGFATSSKGLEVIARQWMADSSYAWPTKTYHVQVSFRLGIVKMVPKEGHHTSDTSPTLTIKPFRRV